MDHITRVLAMEPRVLLKTSLLLLGCPDAPDECSNYCLRFGVKCTRPVLFVTHDVAEAAILADKIKNMSKFARQDCMRIKKTLSKTPSVFYYWTVESLGRKVEYNSMFFGTGK
jgi:ABC-type proline/glycine betaine transport system ATPase subunit